MKRGCEIMESKTVVIIATILSSIVTLLWVLGLIFANINLFILAMIVLAISIYPAIKYFKDITEYFKKRNGEIIEDERTKHIEARATLPTFALILVVSIYAGIAIFTLRNIYPKYVNLAYPFFIIAILGLITYTISRTYYKRKYSD